ncbi:coiled-coil domain-containing protein 178 [Glossophaga mutica]
MPENKTISCSSSEDDQTKKDNSTSQALVLFGTPKEAGEIFSENKMTNTEEVNKGIYFSYPCRRHSCSLVNTPAPCVNKMISHIEGVESKIQERLKQFEASFEEWSRATKDLKEDWSVAAPVSEVKPEKERDEKCPELKQEMETLLSEAAHLIKSLETDRAEAEEALRRQQSRREKINMKIDSWSIWRLQEIPLAVQKEHEAYLRDIVELRWHLEDIDYQRTKLEEQKTKWEEANAKLQADIDYMDVIGPQLHSKLIKEIEALKEYTRKKNEVMDLYRRVCEELKETIENYENAKLKAKKMKEEMEKDICKDEGSIESFKETMEQLTFLYSHYDTLINNVKITLEENEEIVTEVLKETKTSTDELHALVQKKNTWDFDLSNITKDFSDLSITYAQLMNEKRKLENDVETLADSIGYSVRKKSEVESEMQSLMKMKLKNDEYLRKLYKEAYQVGAVFHLTKFKTEELEEQIAEVRRKFKGREEFLKKLTRGAVANGMKIQKKLYALQEQQIFEKQDLLKRKVMYSLILAETETPLVQMEKDAKRIKNVHKEQFEERYLIVFNEIETTKSKTGIYHTKISTLNKDLEEKEEEKKNFKEILDNLKEQFLTVRFKKEQAQAVYDHLMSEKRACEQRLSEEEQRYRALVTKRQKTLADIKKLQDDSLEENLRLAQEYQILQETFLSEKNHYFNLYDRQLSLGASIRDKKELCQLQRRVQKVWQQYLKLVVLHSRMRLAKFQTDSQESIHKILAVQEESSKLMQRIANFFETLSDNACKNDG